jgi:hypothetical protein
MDALFYRLNHGSARPGQWADPSAPRVTSLVTTLAVIFMTFVHFHSQSICSHAAPLLLFLSSRPLYLLACMLPYIHIRSLPT